MISALQVPDSLLEIYNLLVLMAPVFSFLAFVALVIGFVYSPRLRLLLSSRLGKYSKQIDKTAIGDQCAVFMQPRIGSLNDENPEATLPLVKVQFTRILPESTKVDPDDNVVIVLRDSKNKAENLLRIAERYVEKGIMPRGRSIVDKPIEKAVEVTIMFRLLKDIDESLRLWDERHYRHCIDSESTREALEKVHYMDVSGGYLTRLFMPQLELVARRLGPSVSPSVVSESRKWLENVYNISLKHHENPEIYKQETELVFVQDSFKVQVVLVAANWAIRESGIGRHKRRVILGLNNPQITEIYIVAWNKRNCFHGLKLMRETYEDKRIREVWPTFYRTKSRGAEHVPVLLVRYIKGPLEDEEKKRRIVRGFEKETKRKLRQAIVTPKRLIAWLKDNGEQYLGKDREITHLDAGAITKIMNDENMTMEGLLYLFEYAEVELRYRQMIEENEVEGFGARDEIVYRIHALLGNEDSEIVPLLDPKVFMRRRKNLN